jgi:hypothetical protein
LLAVIALVFSFGTTAVSYVRTAQLDSHDRRVELQLSTLEPQVATCSPTPSPSPGLVP